MLLYAENRLQKPGHVVIKLITFKTLQSRLAITRGLIYAHINNISTNQSAILPVLLGNLCICRSAGDVIKLLKQICRLMLSCSQSW